jgi:hypothetical protein
VRPASIEEFAAANSPGGTVEVQTGAWNVGTTSGYDFSQWAGTSTQLTAVEEIWTVRRLFAEISEAHRNAPPNAVARKLGQARNAILEAETSCYLFWGDSWIPKLREHTAAARRILDEIRSD